MASFVPHLARCPLCGAKGRFVFFCSYLRFLISYDHEVVTHTVSIDRYMCMSCGHTHAVLPSVLIPYGSYSLFFILAVMKSYFSRSLTGKTVVDVCEQYQISVSTLYAWKERFLAHKSLWLGILKDQAQDAPCFLHELANFLLCDNRYLERFFTRFGFSFLQNHVRLKTSDSAIP